MFINNHCICYPHEALIKQHLITIINDTEKEHRIELRGRNSSTSVFGIAIPFNLREGSSREIQVGETVNVPVTVLPKSAPNINEIILAVIEEKYVKIPPKDPKIWWKLWEQIGIKPKKILVGEAPVGGTIYISQILANPSNPDFWDLMKDFV